MAHLILTLCQRIYTVVLQSLPWIKSRGRIQAYVHDSLDPAIKSQDDNMVESLSLSDSIGQSRKILPMRLDAPIKSEHDKGASLGYYYTVWKPEDDSDRDDFFRAFCK